MNKEDFVFETRGKFIKFDWNPIENVLNNKYLNIFLDKEDFPPNPSLHATRIIIYLIFFNVDGSIHPFLKNNFS